MSVRIPLGRFSFISLLDIEYVMTKSDTRYNTVRLLITHGKIQAFSEIFDYLPKSILAQELNTNSTRMGKLISQPSNLRLWELKIIADLTNISVDKVISLIDEQDRRTSALNTQG